MRVAFFIPVIAGKGGIESVIANLLERLHADGDEVRLYIYSGSRDKAWLNRIPWVREIGNPAQPRLLRLCTYVSQAWIHMRRWTPDAIVCTHPTTLRLARFVRRVLRLKDVPVILWLHGPLSYHVGVDEVLPSADGHICICQERADEVRSALARIAPASKSPIHTVYNGTSVGEKYSVQPAAIPTFVYMGRLMVGDEKRVGDILSAAALLKGEFRIKIVGDGTPCEVRRLHELADEAGIADKIEWLGWQAEPWLTIPNATALVIASSFEGFSMSIVESLALGVPVVCSDYAGAREQVISGSTGCIFPIGDVCCLAKVMQQIIDGQADLPSNEIVRANGAKFSTGNMAAAFRSALEATRLSMAR